MVPPTPTDLAKLAAMARELKVTQAPDPTPPPASRSLYRRFSPKEIKSITTRYEAGETISSLSREFDISRPALRKILKAEGVSPRRRGMIKADADKAVQLYENGLTIYEVIDKIGYSYGVINRMLHKRGVDLRPRRNQG